MHDFIVKRAVDFVLDLLLHSLRAPATNARHFYSCFQACILPPNFLTGSLRKDRATIDMITMSRHSPSTRGRGGQRGGTQVGRVAFG